MANFNYIVEYYINICLLKVFTSKTTVKLYLLAYGIQTSVVSSSLFSIRSSNVKQYSNLSLGTQMFLQYAVCKAFLTKLIIRIIVVF